MSELKTADKHDAPHTSGAEVDEHPVDLNSYIRTCFWVFVTVVCSVSLMLWASYLPQDHFSWTAKITIILIVASINAFVVAGFLMHLISEKKMVYTVLAFTVFFAVAMMWLTLYAMHDFPTGTTY